jgi:hypothetical protein
MSDLAYDIEQLYIEGHSPRMISYYVGVPHRAGSGMVGGSRRRS